MLQIDRLCVAYGEKVVLREITLTVQPGQILALIGPNGAGKSTLIRAVAGVIPLRSGRITYDGQNLDGMSPARRARILAVVPQARPLGGAFSVEQAVMLGRTPYLSWLGKEGETDRRAVARALRQTGLEGFSDRQIASLSGGEQQRVLLARALAQDTPALLLDEPTNHLDLQHQMSLLTLVRRLARENNLAVMMALHDLNLVSAFADRVALLVGGALKGDGAPGEVLRADWISAAYQIPVEVFAHPLNGDRLVFPAHPAREAELQPAGELG